MRTPQKLLLVGVLAANLLLWLIPSDVVEAVARDREILLGRYSRTQFAWMLGLLPISAIVLLLGLAPSAELRKRRGFRLAAVLIVLVPALLAVDFTLRLRKDWGYVLDGMAYHRTPNRVFHGEFADRPESHLSYPDAPAGYGTIAWTLTTDARGFRNPTALEQCDIVAVGDSFTEGSQVTDGDVWTVKFTQHTRQPVYNIASSGYAPQNSAVALEKYGLPLKPKWVIFLLYEGNDFRQAKAHATAPAEWSRFFKQSPLLSAFDQFLVDRLGPIGASRHVPGIELLSWMPLEYPPGANARHYAFPPSFLIDQLVTRQEFESGRDWSQMRELLDGMRQLCEKAGAKFAIGYAPIKSRVIMPLVREALPADKVRQFTALRSKRKLPPPAEFMNELFADFDTFETVTAEWCRAKAVAFISLTEPMRAAARAGRQPYFTYNAHWTPLGHEAAAQAIAEAWKQSSATSNGLISDAHSGH